MDSRYYGGGRSMSGSPKTEDDENCGTCQSPSCFGLATIKLDISVDRSPSPCMPRLDMGQHPGKHSRTRPHIPPEASDRPVYKGNIMHISPAYTFNFNVTDGRAETVDYMTIYNITDRPLAYKVKTTNPDNYRVRTSSGVVQSKGSTNVFVYLQPGVLNVSQDKFLVMGLLVDDANAKGAALSQLWKVSPKDNSTFCDHKLWCTVTDQANEPKSDVDRIMDRMGAMETKENHHRRVMDSSADNFTESDFERRRHLTKRRKRGSAVGRGSRLGYDTSYGSFSDEIGLMSRFISWISSILLWPFSTNTYEDFMGDNDNANNMDRVLAKQEMTERRLQTVSTVLCCIAAALLVLTLAVGIEFVSDLTGTTSRACANIHMR